MVPDIILNLKEITFILQIFHLILDQIICHSNNGIFYFSSINFVFPSFILDSAQLLCNSYSYEQ